MHIGECIARERKNLNISQRELGRRADVTGQMISRIESCTTNPTVNMIIKISTALGVMASDLVKDADGYEGLVEEFKNIETNTFSLGKSILDLITLINATENDCHYDMQKLLKDKDFFNDMTFSIIGTIKNRLNFYNNKDVK